MASVSNRQHVGIISLINWVTSSHILILFFIVGQFSSTKNNKSSHQWTALVAYSSVVASTIIDIFYYLDKYSTLELKTTIIVSDGMVPPMWCDSREGRCQTFKYGTMLEGAIGVRMTGLGRWQNVQSFHIAIAIAIVIVIVNVNFQEKPNRKCKRPDRLTY